MNLSLEELLTKGRFKNSEEFSVYVETKAAHTHSSCIETLLAVCEELSLDVEGAAKFITASLKDKIRAEAESRNLLTTKTTTLPL